LAKAPSVKYGIKAAPKLHMAKSKSTTLSQGRSTQQIPFDRWTPFLDEFTRENRGAHARLEVLGSDVGYQVETENRPFDGISVDVKDGESNVWITFGSTTEDHMTHGIQAATVIRMLLPTNGGGPVLEVEARDGTTTLLELTSPEAYALPPGSRRQEGMQGI
jgi:uncharacterized protein DUF5335